MSAMSAASGDTSERDGTARSCSTTTGGIHHALVSSTVDQLVGLHPRKSPLTASILDSPLLRRLRETAELLDPNVAEVPRCGTGGPTCFGSFPKPKPQVKDLLDKAIPTELKAMRLLAAPAAQAGNGSSAAAEASVHAIPHEGLHGPVVTAAGDVDLVSEIRLTFVSGTEHPAGGVGMHDTANAKDVTETQGTPIAPVERIVVEEEEEGHTSATAPSADLGLQLQSMQAEFAQLTERLQRQQQEQIALLQEQLVEQQHQLQGQMSALQEELVKHQLLLRDQQAPSQPLALSPPGPQLHVKLELTDDQVAPRTPDAPDSVAVPRPTTFSSALPVLRSRLTPQASRALATLTTPSTVPPLISTVDSAAEPDRCPISHSDDVVQRATQSRDIVHEESQSAGYSTGRDSGPHTRQLRDTPRMQDF